MKRHILYRTTCEITGKYYIGIHTTSNVNDGYMGSGKILKRSINKHGIENHHIEILEECSTREDLLLRERSIVTAKLISDPMCMNIRPGGQGGFGEENAKRDRQIRANAASQIAQKKLREDEQWNRKKSEAISRANVEQYENGSRPRYHFFDSTGMVHTEETRAKISQRHKDSGHCRGERNPNFGRTWLHHPEEKISRSFHQHEIEDMIAQGWVRGRKIKW